MHDNSALPEVSSLPSLRNTSFLFFSPCLCSKKAKKKKRGKDKKKFYFRTMTYTRTVGTPLGASLCLCLFVVPNEKIDVRFRLHRNLAWSVENTFHFPLIVVNHCPFCFCEPWKSFDDEHQRGKFPPARWPLWKGMLISEAMTLDVFWWSMMGLRDIR